MTRQTIWLGNWTRQSSIKNHLARKQKVLSSHIVPRRCCMTNHGGHRCMPLVEATVKRRLPYRCECVVFGWSVARRWPPGPILSHCRQSRTAASGPIGRGRRRDLRASYMYVVTTINHDMGPIGWPDRPELHQSSVASSAC